MGSGFWVAFGFWKQNTVPVTLARVDARDAPRAVVGDVVSHLAAPRACAISQFPRAARSHCVCRRLVADAHAPAGVAARGVFGINGPIQPQPALPKRARGTQPLRVRNGVSVQEDVVARPIFRVHKYGGVLVDASRIQAILAPDITFKRWPDNILHSLLFVDWVTR